MRVIMIAVVIAAVGGKKLIFRNFRKIKSEAIVEETARAKFRIMFIDGELKYAVSKIRKRVIESWILGIFKRFIKLRLSFHREVFLQSFLQSFWLSLIFAPNYGNRLLRY